MDLIFNEMIDMCWNTDLYFYTQKGGTLTVNLFYQTHTNLICSVSVSIKLKVGDTPLSSPQCLLLLMMCDLCDDVKYYVHLSLSRYLF